MKIREKAPERRYEVSPSLIKAGISSTPIPTSATYLIPTASFYDPIDLVTCIIIAYSFIQSKCIELYSWLGLLLSSKDSRMWQTLTIAQYPFSPFSLLSKCQFCTGQQCVWSQIICSSPLAARKDLAQLAATLALQPAPFLSSGK